MIHQDFGHVIVEWSDFIEHLMIFFIAINTNEGFIFINCDVQLTMFLFCCGESRLVFLLQRGTN